MVKSLGISLFDFGSVYNQGARYGGSSGVVHYSQLLSTSSFCELLYISYIKPIANEIRLPNFVS